MRQVNILTAITAALVLTGCAEGYIPERTRYQETPPPYFLAEELFVSEDNGEGITRTVFRTNDMRYWTLEGLTMWTVWGESEAEFEKRTVKMAKSRGYAGGGYGIVFCHGEYNVEGIQTPAMLVVMINNEGYYIIGKVQGGIFNDFGWWKATPYLNKSAGYLNEVTVSYEKGNGEYILEINGNEIERFRDDNEPALRGGKNGYVVVITPFDKFPDSGIDVYFLEER